MRVVAVQRINISNLHDVISCKTSGWERVMPFAASTTFSFSCVSRTVLPSIFFLQLCLSLRKNLTALRSNRNSEPPVGESMLVSAAMSKYICLRCARPQAVCLKQPPAMPQLLCTWRLARRLSSDSQVELCIIQQHVTHFSVLEPGAHALFQNVSHLVRQVRFPRVQGLSHLRRYETVLCSAAVWDAGFPQDAWRRGIRSMRPGCNGRMLTFAPRFLDKHMSVQVVTCHTR